MLNNSDGTISKIDYYDRVSGTTFAAYYRYEFSYASGKLSKVTEYDLGNSTPEKTWEYTYTYTGNNITGYTFIATGSHVPEPASCLLLGAGLCALGIWRGRRINSLR